MVLREVNGHDSNTGRSPQSAVVRSKGTAADAILIGREATLGHSLTGPSSFQLGVKRTFDIAMSSIALIVLSPVLLAIALLIYLQDGHAALFAQERWGHKQRIIKVLKFRTMYVKQSDRSGAIQAESPCDPRITPIGRLLRRTSLDELPQLFNVLMGDMSLVGPRCHPIGMLAAGRPYEELVPEYHLRHTVKPGMTGLAQSHGYRGPTHDLAAARRRIELDLEYINNFGLVEDIRIILKTVVIELRGGSGF